MRQRDGKPLWVNESLYTAQPLQRADLSIASAAGGYDEDWLQNLLYHCPEVLPVEQVEPGFSDLARVIKETTGWPLSLR
jgi:hypothetical protein